MSEQPVNVGDVIFYHGEAVLIAAVYLDDDGQGTQYWRAKIIHADSSRTDISFYGKVYRVIYHADTGASVGAEGLTQ